MFVTSAVPHQVRCKLHLDMTVSKDGGPLVDIADYTKWLLEIEE